MLEDPSNTEILVTIVLSAGALGTAAFGIVDGLKWTSIGATGFNSIKKFLGNEVMKTLEHAYGTDYEKLLVAQYREGRAKGPLKKTLRQGIRIGLAKADFKTLAAQLPGVTDSLLENASQKINDGQDPTDEERMNLARFEFAINARIDAALALAEGRYVGANRIYASIIAVLLAVIAEWQIQGEITFLAFVIGISAVPIAPIAKDIATGLRSSEKALKAKAQ